MSGRAADGRSVHLRSARPSPRLNVLPNAVVTFANCCPGLPATDAAVQLLPRTKDISPAGHRQRYARNSIGPTAPESVTVQALETPIALQLQNRTPRPDSVA